MSSCIQTLESAVSEQLCYVQCSYCNTILLVSVPCNSMYKVVAVRCGHCSNLLSVNMLKASFVPLQFLASHSTHDQHLQYNEDACRRNEKNVEHELPPFSPLCEEEKRPPFIVNKPPEKRHRAPSAYNRFIKEEIQRLKSSDPNITHKEAFSTAAKNWALLPRIHRKLPEMESWTQTHGSITKDKDQQFIPKNKVGASDHVFEGHKSLMGHYGRKRPSTID